MNEEEYSYDDAEQDQTASGSGDIFANVAQGLTGAHKAQLVAYWQQAIDGIERIGDPGSSDGHFKSTALPLARIKKVMKTDSEVRMISAEAPIVFAKGCDIFITELTMRAWIHAEESKRRTLQRSDIAMALQKSDMFDFLIDIVPREEAMPRRFHTQPQQTQQQQPDQILHHQDDDITRDLPHSLQHQHQQHQQHQQQQQQQQIQSQFHPGSEASHGVMGGLAHMSAHLNDQDDSPLEQHLINPGSVGSVHVKADPSSPSVNLGVASTLADPILRTQNNAHSVSEAGPILDGAVGSHHDDLVQPITPSQQPDSSHGSPIVSSHDQEFSEQDFDYTGGYEDAV